MKRLAGGIVLLVAATVARHPVAAGTSPHGDAPPAAAEARSAPATADYDADGRLPLGTIMARFDTLSSRHGWLADSIYAYPDAPEVAIRSWRTPHEGEALWILAGIHGEEPAGPNAIAANLASLTRLAASGVPIVVIPLANPNAYRHNWRYPNTPERDWKTGGGYSVGDAEHLLQAAGIPVRDSGQTRFGETIVRGVISRDDRGGPIRDGSIDELLAATEVFVDGRKVRGPAAHTVIVVETPAFAGSQFDKRVAAQGAVVQHAGRLWRVIAGDL